MKKIYFGSSEAPSGGNEPFWKPWGLGGWLLRLVGFLILLFAQTKFSVLVRFGMIIAELIIIILMN